MNKKICFYMPPFPCVQSYRDMIDVAEKYGVSAVEGFSTLDFKLPDKEAAKRIREYADSKNIVFPCFSVYINLVGKDSAKMIQRAKDYADVASILGSPYLHHTIACEFSEPDNVLPYKEELFEKGISAVREIYDYAESIGVKAIYEEQGYLFNGVEGFGRFLNAVEREVGVVADFGNIYQSGDNTIDFIKAYSDRFAHAHIKEIFLTDTNETGRGLKTLDGKYMNETPIGHGEVKIKEAVDRLKKSGYSGYYGIEYGAKDDGSPLIGEALELVDALL